MALNTSCLAICVSHLVAWPLIAGWSPELRTVRWLICRRPRDLNGGFSSSCRNCVQQKQKFWQNVWLPKCLSGNDSFELVMILQWIITTQRRPFHNFWLSVDLMLDKINHPLFLQIKTNTQTNAITFERARMVLHSKVLSPPTHRECIGSMKFIRMNSPFVMWPSAPDNDAGRLCTEPVNDWKWLRINFDMALICQT